MHSTQTLLRAQRGAGEATNREEIKKAIWQNNKGYYKKSNKNHFLGQNYHGQSFHRGRGRGANNNRHYGKRKSTSQWDKQE